MAKPVCTRLSPVATAALDAKCVDLGVDRATWLRTLVHRDLGIDENSGKIPDMANASVGGRTQSVSGMPVEAVTGAEIEVEPSEDCPHPAELLRTLAYGVVCGRCDRKVG